MPTTYSCQAKYWALLLCFLGSMGCVVITGPISLVFAEEPPSSSPSDASLEESLEQRRLRLRQELEAIERRLDALRTKEQRPSDVESPAPGKAAFGPEAERLEEDEEPVVLMKEVRVIGRRLESQPTGITKSTVPRQEFTDQPALNFREALESYPGVVLRKTNGPRDFKISIRGFGAKQSFGVKKIKLFEDGISLTQSDGLSRLDLPDPWFMKAVEVERGPASALYGNYALGGAVHFLTRRGADINGADLLVEGGSFGRIKTATALGDEYAIDENAKVDTAIFLSHDRGDGFIDHSGFWTTTEDFNLRFNLSDDHTFFFKAANNNLDTDVPNRLTLSQFQTDPRQAGTGAKEFDRSRVDQRTIIGARYEGRLTEKIAVEVGASFDNKDVNQKFGVILDQVQPNFKTHGAVQHHTTLWGGPLRSRVGVFFDYLETETTFFRQRPDFHGTKLNAISNTRGNIRNLGFNLREEWEFVPRWTLAAGFGFENSAINIDFTAFDFFTGAFDEEVIVNRRFNNVAPDLSLTYRSPEGSRYWSRISGGYGIPDFTDLTTGPSGLPAPNTGLKSEKNINVELGSDLVMHPRFRVQLVGFWTFFKNELITANVSTPFGTVGSFTTNADLSEYRGIETGWLWEPIDGLIVNGTYTHTDARFINFEDQIVVGGVTQMVPRDGNKVPAVKVNILNIKTAYDHPTGPGGWVEVSWLDDFFVNNANTLKAKANIITNVNFHHRTTIQSKWIRFASVFFEVENVFDAKFMAGSAIISDSVPDPQKQAFFLGQPRSFIAGLTLGLF